MDTLLSLIDSLKREMNSGYGVDPRRVRIVRAPYRVCPLGAHIDHQQGVVTALAIDQAAHLAYAPSGSPEVRLRSLAFDGEVRFSLEQIPPRQPGDWGNYVRGAAQALQAGRPLSQGIVGITSGSLAEGGLSSSAAIGVAYLLALEEANGLSVSPTDNIRLDQSIEHDYLGLRNGILDQAAILCSRRGYLTVIDCRAFASASSSFPSHSDSSLDLAPNPNPKPTPIPIHATSLPPGLRLLAPPANLPPWAILVAFSGVAKSLVTTAYNLRVQECAQAAATLLRAAGRPQQPPFLGLVGPDEYRAYRHLLSGAPTRRAEHFFTEMERAQQGIAAWQRGDLKTLGNLMTESGDSSIRSYECGSPPLIDLYELLRRTEGVYGARFSGAGFRGCCIALADPETVRAAIPSLRQAYAQRQPQWAANAPVLLCESADGARIL